MHPLVEAIFAISVIVAAVALAIGAAQLWQLRSFLESGRLRVTANMGDMGSDGSSRWAMSLFSSHAGFAIFVYRGGKWVLEADHSKPGYEAVAPTIPGTYENQVVKKESALRTKG